MGILRVLGRLIGALLGLLVLAVLSILGWWHFGDWQKRAVADVQFVHDTIMAHHPGPVDPENPAFREVMDEAYEAAMAMALDAQSAEEHHEAVKQYTRAFNDGHLSLWFADRQIARLLRPKLTASGTSSRPLEIGIEAVAGGYWITIPSFTEQRAPIDALTKEIEARAEELRSGELLVLDVRGNSGGNSAFGNRIAKAIWSEEVYADWVPASATGVDWRATPENAKHVYGIARSNAKKGRPEYAASWERVADGIAQAVEDGADYYRQNLTQREITKTAESPVTAQVVVITDARCASACLDFMDKLKALPGALHIGAETGSDTQYIDVRFVPIKSKTAILILPLKVYRGRLRPSGGSYLPDVELDPESVDLAAVMQVLDAQDRRPPEPLPLTGGSDGK